MEWAYDVGEGEEVVEAEVTVASMDRTMLALVVLERIPMMMMMMNDDLVRRWVG